MIVFGSIALALVAILVLLGIRTIPTDERAAVVRRGTLTNRVVGPGRVWILPMIESLRVVHIEPFSVSLPPQSAITRDEIPIQLQASLDATVVDFSLAATCKKDWRITLVSVLQNLMKDKLEELDFDTLDVDFPRWIEAIRREMDATAQQCGVVIKHLKIANLSPRTKPSI